MKIAVCEFKGPSQEIDSDFLDAIHKVKADITVFNEMPFGSWLAESEVFDQKKYDQSVDVHHHCIEQLKNFSMTHQHNFILSKPCYEKDQRVNRVVSLVNGEEICTHTKQKFPQKPGYWEKSWFGPGETKFELLSIENVKIGILLCTDSMYMEFARLYSQKGASVIVVARATSGDSDKVWMSTLKVMAMQTGCYVVSSNRRSLPGAAQTFNGTGMIFNPVGDLMAKTSEQNPIVSTTLDLALVNEAKASYPFIVY